MRHFTAWIVSWGSYLQLNSLHFLWYLRFDGCFSFYIYFFCVIVLFVSSLISLRYMLYAINYLFLVMGFVTEVTKICSIIYSHIFASVIIGIIYFHAFFMVYCLVECSLLADCVWKWNCWSDEVDRSNIEWCKLSIKFVFYHILLIGQCCCPPLFVLTSRPMANEFK